jgi:hypothetical protein
MENALIRNGPSGTSETLPHDEKPTSQGPSTRRMNPLTYISSIPVSTACTTKRIANRIKITLREGFSFGEQ